MEGVVEVDGGEEVVGGGEEGVPAEGDAECAIGDDAGETGGDDDFGFEVGRAVENFGGEERAGERGAEDGGDAGAHAGGHENAAVFGLEFEDAFRGREPKPAPI